MTWYNMIVLKNNFVESLHFERLRIKFRKQGRDREWYTVEDIVFLDFRGNRSASTPRRGLSK